MYIGPIHACTPFDIEACEETGYRVVEGLLTQ